MLALLFVTLVTCDSSKASSMKFGIITKKSNELKMLDTFGNNITVDIRTVDTSEIYQVYRTVQVLDIDASIDAIVLFDDIPIDLQTEQLIAPNNKKIIHWHLNDKIQNQNIKTAEKYNITFPDCSNECGRTRTLYCQTDDITVSNGEESFSMFVPETVLSATASLSWKKVIIFYETATEYEMSRLVDMLSKKGIMFATFNIEHVEDVHHLLHRIYYKRLNNEPINSDMNFIIMCKIQYTMLILRKANAFDYENSGRSSLLKKFSRWLIVGYGYCKCVYDSLQYSVSDLDNVAIIAIPPEAKTRKDFCLTLSNVTYDVKSLQHENENIDFVEKVVEKLEEAARRSCKGYIIETLLWTRDGRDFAQVGFVEASGNAVLNGTIFPNMNYGYNNREFMVSTIPYPPFVIKNVNNGTTTFEGFCIDLLNELARVLNFTYSIMEVPDGFWGVYDSEENFTFNGLVGQLQRMEIDIAAAPISEQPERHRVIDFSYPLFYEHTTVVVKKPDPSATKWKKLLDPLKWEVLVAVAVAFVVVTILTFLIEKWNPYYIIEEHAKEKEEKGLQTWLDTFWYMYGALLCQGGVHLPDSIAGRTLVSSWWIFCIIIVGTYCGNLTAFLTVTKEIPPFNTLDEMVDMKNEYKWGTLGGSNWDMIFRTSTNPTFREVGDTMIENSKYDPDVFNPNVSAHIEKVMKENYAWIGDETSIQLAMVKECDLMVTKERFIPMSYAFGLINNSPHGPLISKHIIKIHESGIFEIWKRKWWPKADLCAKNTVTAKPISLVDVQSAFYVCCIGIFLGFVVLLLEIAILKVRNATDICKTKVTNCVEQTEEL